MTEKKDFEFQISNLYKGFYAGMPRNGHLESKTPHCALSVANDIDIWQFVAKKSWKS